MFQNVSIPRFPCIRSTQMLVRNLKQNILCVSLNLFQWFWYWTAWIAWWRMPATKEITTTNNATKCCMPQSQMLHKEQSGICRFSDFSRFWDFVVERESKQHTCRLTEGESEGKRNGERGRQGEGAGHMKRNAKQLKMSYEICSVCWLRVLNSQMATGGWGGAGGVGTSEGQNNWWHLNTHTHTQSARKSSHAPARRGGASLSALRNWNKKRSRKQRGK